MATDNPPSGKFTEEVRTTLVALLASGSSRRMAARFIGVDPGTLSRYLQRHMEFRDEVTRAEANVQIEALRRIRHAAQDPRYWRAAAWLLERRYPADFGPRPIGTYTQEETHDLITCIGHAVANLLPPQHRSQIDQAVEEAAHGLQDGVPVDVIKRQWNRRRPPLPDHAVVSGEGSSPPLHDRFATPGEGRCEPAHVQPQPSAGLSGEAVVRDMQRIDQQRRLKVGWYAPPEKFAGKSNRASASLPSEASPEGPEPDARNTYPASSHSALESPRLRSPTAVMTSATSAASPTAQRQHDALRAAAGDSASSRSRDKKELPPENLATHPK